MPAPTIGPQPTILATWFCPFAQRTLIAANFKKPGLQYTLHEVTFDELYGKPGKPKWFTDLNPQGLVPVIAFQPQQAAQQHHQAWSPTAAATPGVVAIKESLVCNEFLEDTYPEPPLLPQDPVAKAAARLIITRFSDKAVPAFYRMLVQQDPAVQAAAAAVLDAELQWLVQHIHPEGPLALGPQLSMVDAAVAPWLIRLDILEHYRQYTSYRQLQEGAVGRRLQQYLSALQQHPAVAATMYHPEGLDYKQQLLLSYQRYADNTTNSMVARDARQA